MLRSNLNIWLTVIIFLLGMGSISFAGKTIYVDSDATGVNDGSSWADAYHYLQEALSDANSAEKPVEIRVAQGIYRPNQGLIAIPDFDWRTTTFQLINGVTVKGSYAGFGKPDPNARDIGLNETVLSGDLSGNDAEIAVLLDLIAEPTRAENSYNVVTAIGTDETAVLDGLIITAGNADGPSFTDPNSNGGGMNNYNSSPTIISCVFTGNAARWDGGGMYNRSSNPVLINCIFSRNAAGDTSTGYGGGMDNHVSNPILINCTFSSNWAGQGGGINAVNSTPIAIDCTFKDNSANFGGAMQYKGCMGPMLNNCAFCGNTAHRGAAARYINSIPLLSNCMFGGNWASNSGGGINCTNTSTLTLTNCTFATNSAAKGSALACDFKEDQLPGDVSLTNCILWDNGDEIWNEDGSTITIAYTDVQGGQTAIYDPCNAVVWSEGNIDADPYFASPGYWAAWDDLSVVVEPNEPNAVWIDGDYHLKSQAGRWDPNNGVWVQDEVTSPCIDAGDPNSPFALEPLPNGDRINMGAYGGTVEASKSNFKSKAATSVVSRL